jgi:hypothetical protein
MKDLLKIFLVLFFISLLTFSSISVFAEDLNISNQTNDTNATNSTTNGTKNVASDGIIQPMSLTTSISVTPQNINLGTWPADGTEHTITNAATVQVNASNFIFGGDGQLRVRASGDFASGTNTIPLSNFKFDCPGNITKTTFTTSDIVIDDYSPPFIGTIRNTYHINYYITVPPGTYPGTYSTTIIYTAT